MNTSSVSTALLSVKGLEFNGSFSEKNLSPAKRSGSPSPIGNRLQNLRAQLDSYTDTTEFEKRVRILDEKVTETHFATEEKLKTFAEQVDRIEARLIEQAGDLDALNVATVSEINEVQKNTLLQMEQENQHFKENRPLVLQGIEDKLYDLKATTVQEQHQKREHLNKQQDEIANQIESLSENLFKEINARKDDNLKIINKVGDRLNKIQDTLVDERKSRQNTEEVLFRALEDANKKLQIQVNNERAKRERVEGQMLALLEEAMGKLEKGIPIQRKQKKWEC